MRVAAFSLSGLMAVLLAGPATAVWTASGSGLSGVFDVRDYGRFPGDCPRCGGKDISGSASHHGYTWLSLSGADPSDILVGTSGGGAYIGHDSETEK